MSSLTGNLFTLPAETSNRLKNFEFEQLRDLVSQSSRIVVTSHHNPDGDAIGSVLAMSWLLKKLGKEVTPIVPNDYPAFLKWMPGNNTVAIFSKDQEKCISAITEAQLIFCLDYSALSRTGAMQESLQLAPGLKILVDHHLEPALNDFGLHYSIISISSTSELVYRLMNECGWMELLDQDIATGLAVGIMTDTGSFSFSCNYPETFESIAALIRTGIDLQQIHRLVYDTYSENRLRLLGFCLSEKLTVLQEFSTAYIALTREELYKFHYEVGDTEGVVNYALSIDNIKLAVLLTERKDRIRLSFRSKGIFSVNTLAREHFNGGGHRNAAGGDSFASMEDTVSKLKEVLAQYQAEINRS